MNFSPVHDCTRVVVEDETQGREHSILAGLHLALSGVDRLSGENSSRGRFSSRRDCSVSFEEEAAAGGAEEEERMRGLETAFFLGEHASCFDQAIEDKEQDDRHQRSCLRLFRNLACELLKFTVGDLCVGSCTFPLFRYLHNHNATFFACIFHCCCPKGRKRRSVFHV